ncbi:Membrane protein involved in the export of O-antigen and teichoic acid [Aquimarina amphilecti]|uniref:Membrane protein involved in the export of O-antigen and teichoic acid n=1 Tax=Aquimarina amphilecti TaxID=1038014 RepID=A0A1H7XEF2_AQUAM|nr:lipopolysaccharide biosynthesis protein [Aquimarina amphilecti]SEM31409.1 Membrane protein involved in the export of O-antigen and teichoic acid [Aquimarina amphilecti]
MGIVVNQSIKNVIITCLGFGIGAINTLFLFTKFIDEEYYGLVSYLFSVSNLIWPLMAFGAHNTIVKFYSSYSDKKERNRFMTIMLISPLFIAIIIGAIGSVSYKYIQDFFSDNNSIVQPYIWTIYVITIALSYFEIFFAWAKVKLKSVFGNILKELFVRVCIMILLILVYFEIITVVQFIYAIVIVYIARLCVMVVYVYGLQDFKFSFSLPKNYSSVFKYSLLILLAGSVATFLIDLDKTMIERYLLIEYVAKYGICAYIASVIIIPSRAMHQITYPLTAKLINEKKIKELKVLYEKSSLNLFAISGLLFVLILCNVNQLFELIPQEYELFIWVVVLIGSAKLFDNLLGNNNSILFNSDYYRLILYIGIGMAILAFILNWICIPIFGVEGAAIATFAAVFCYNLAKVLIVQIKFKMHPFSKKTFLILMLIIIFVFGFYFWDFGFYPIVNIALKSIIIGIAYIALLYFLKISDDINTIIKKIPRGA